MVFLAARRSGTEKGLGLVEMRVGSLGFGVGSLGLVVGVGMTGIGLGLMSHAAAGLVPMAAIAAVAGLMPKAAMASTATAIECPFVQTWIIFLFF